MFFSTFYVTRWYALLIIAVIAGCLIAIPNKVCSQGIFITGVGEGDMIVLPSNITTTNLAVTATPVNPAGTTNVIFVLERQGSIFINRTSPPPYSLTLSNLTAGKYYLSASLVATGATANGNVSFDIKAASVAPANDDWNQATMLNGLNTTVTSSNVYATSEPNEPVHGGIGVGKSVWWSWTAVSNGVFTATTAGSSFDTVLGVYTGTNLSTLTEIGANDDAGPNTFSQVTFFATNGTIYYFAVDSATSTTGKAQLRLVAGLPPMISIASPADGVLFLVASPSVTTNAQAIASISDSTGIARVDYWFDGGASAGRNGILSSPYQLSLTNLFAGHYVLTLMASNNVGLVSVTNAGLSVISLEPVLAVDGFVPGSGKFQMAVTGFKGPTYALEATTNLDVWCSLNKWTNFAGAEKVTDTNAAQFNKRFYRASSTQ